jgi:hypothetical protein
MSAGVPMRTIFLICCVAFLAAPVAFAESEAIRTMATITKNLNHFPSDADKQKLANIINSDESSEAEIAVASAISDFEHKVSESDSAELQSVIDDESAPAELRKLASILMTINHSPSESDMEKLDRIASAT